MDKKNIEDLYPLSPLQEGMLFHSSQSPHSGVYITQNTCVLEGDLNVAVFEQAWQRIVARYAVLRSGFVWGQVSRPLQVVFRRVALRVEQQDWSALTEDEQEGRLREWLRDDRRRGYDLTQAPLMRLVLARVAPNAYQFLWSSHHILMDGWSGMLVLQEVLAVYEALRLGREPRLERSRPFRDYIAWLGRQDLSAAEHFWRRSLAGFTAPTRLRVARPHPSARDAGTSERQASLGEGATAGLRAAARRLRLTLNTLVQGAWALLLSRYSGDRDVVFGMNVSGRPPELAGVERMVGLFINTLPVRARVCGGERVGEWLRGLQAGQAEAGQYEYSPLVEVQKWSEVGRGVPLFDTILVFENFPTTSPADAQEASLRVRMGHHLSQTNYPLSMVVAPGTELLLRAYYDRGLFDDETVGRMLGHFRTLLEAIAADPDRPVSDLPMLTERERQQLLFEWNDTRVPYDEADLPLHRLVEQQVSRTPDATALAFMGEELSYRELNERANQLARHLRGLGVSPEQRVGVLMRRSAEMVVSLLAVLKAGGAYVPLDPEYPRERLEFMLEDAHVKVLLTQEGLAGVAGAQAAATMVCVDAEWEEVARHAGENLADGAGAGNLAYVIYTSGSTGSPKGVLVPHGNLCSLSVAQRETFGLGVGERVLQFSSLSFDASVWELVMALTSGATLVMSSRERMRTGAELLKVLGEERITVATLPPSMLAALKADGLPHFQTVITGGESCPAEAVNRWSPGRRFFNVYGPTEATCVAVLRQCSGTYAESPPIGRPIANTRAYVLDRDLQPAPVGVPGELHLGGAGLARGYHERPGFTAEKFIPDPFGGEPGARLYKTGDLVRYLPDGDIEFLGRSDRQVKLRGFRIELGEIEAALVRHPGVVEALVTVREDAEGQRQLLAYLVADGGRPTPTVTELRGFLGRTLPEHMLPALFIFLERFPLNANGKVDRGALPAPEGERPGLAGDYVAPRTHVEEVVAGLWRQALGLQQVGVHDAFYEVGGDSLKIIKVFGLLNEKFPQVVTMADLFKHNTVASLSARIEEALRPGAATNEVERIEL